MFMNHLKWTTFPNNSKMSFVSSFANRLTCYLESFWVERTWVFKCVYIFDMFSWYSPTLCRNMYNSGVSVRGVSVLRTPTHRCVSSCTYFYILVHLWGCTSNTEVVSYFFHHTRTTHTLRLYQSFGFSLYYPLTVLNLDPFQLIITLLKVYKVEFLCQISVSLDVEV